MEWSVLTHGTNKQVRNSTRSISPTGSENKCSCKHIGKHFQTAFAISKGLKQHICLSTDKLLENCDLYAVDYYFAMKRNEVLEYNIYLSLDTSEKHE